MTQEDLPGSSVGADDQQPEDEAICLRQPRRDDDNTCAACDDMQASALKKLLKTQQVEGRSDGVAGWSKLLDECSSVLRPVLCQEDLPGSADGAEYRVALRNGPSLSRPSNDISNHTTGSTTRPPGTSVEPVRMCWATDPPNMSAKRV